MKIGIDASRYADGTATGVEWYSFHIINGLLDEFKGHDIILYSKKHLRIKGKKFKNRVLEARRFWTLRRLSKEMKENPPDVLFVPSHTLPLTLPKKSVITIHDVAFKKLRKAYSWLQYKYLDWSTGYAVKNATKIIVPSEATKEDLIKYYKCQTEKIEVVYHGFTPPDVKGVDKVFSTSKVFEYFDIKKDSKYILFVGRLESKKNLVRLIEAFAEFSEFHPDYRLILAGKRGVGFEQIIKVVNRLKIADRVIMPGYITEEEKAALYKYCAAFAFPSLYEGFGLPILESFYYEKPVLTSHFSCLPEVAGDAAYYVDPYDVESIVEGLNKVVDNKFYVEKIVKLGSKRLESFRWGESATQTARIILK